MPTIVPVLDTAPDISVPAVDRFPLCITVVPSVRVLADSTKDVMLAMLESVVPENEVDPLLAGLAFVHSIEPLNMFPLEALLGLQAP